MSNENLSPKGIRKILKEIKTLSETPIKGITVENNRERLNEIRATIEGPESTPFEGGVFKMKLVLESNFPNSPPKGYFITKIFHPNVATTGEICLNTLKKDWKPELGLGEVLQTIKCLLIYPNAESALNEEAGKLILENYDEYSRYAKLMTKIHASSSERTNSENTTKKRKKLKKTTSKSKTKTKKSSKSKSKTSTAGKKKKRRKNLKRL
ncbi:hypothetical protein M0813_02031 [Anaeramoeba flamelloides]|uniref:UBC core domain-containing protein n=1 Tax=Anaeramoeba flamelloides TaxID=1746091 RepID=A0ABQ8YQC6_9EUKA|nr:hypothetical protein M0813_02031 [Anaeramoeba flamelloides]